MQFIIILVAEKSTTPSKKNRAEQRHLTIQIRNARERSRIYEINQAFARLRQAIPYSKCSNLVMVVVFVKQQISFILAVGRTKRISKVKTLEKALQYITELETQLELVFV